MDALGAGCETDVVKMGVLNQGPLKPKEEQESMRQEQVLEQMRLEQELEPMRHERGHGLSMRQPHQERG